MPVCKGLIKQGLELGQSPFPRKPHLDLQYGGINWRYRVTSGNLSGWGLGWITGSYKAMVQLIGFNPWRIKTSKSELLIIIRSSHEVPVLVE